MASQPKTSRTKKPRKSLASRFWGKVRKGVRCWEWTGALVRGYGQLHVGVGRPPVRAHRVSWVLHYGRIPDGLHVLHKCDNPKCVRPTHLFLGTALVNAQDRKAKGRGKAVGPGKGEAHHSAKLTGQDVLDIRKRLAAGESGKELAKEYGIAGSTVSNLRTGKRWGHLGGQTAGN